MIAIVSIMSWLFISGTCGGQSKLWCKNRGKINGLFIGKTRQRLKQTTNDAIRCGISHMWASTSPLSPAQMAEHDN